MRTPCRAVDVTDTTSPPDRKVGVAAPHVQVIPTEAAKGRRGRLRAASQHPGHLGKSGWLVCFEKHPLYDLIPMAIFQTLQTWEVLKELGFMPNASVWSEIQPGLSFDFGNFILSAGAVKIGWRLTPVILLMRSWEGSTEVRGFRIFCEVRDDGCHHGRGGRR